MRKMDLKNEQQPILSIAVPTYNGSKTISYMLDLLLAQYDPRVEILISDNQSTDETPRILEEYVKNYSFLKVIRNQKNVGPDANFLNGLRLAQGKFVLLLSDDDILIENALIHIIDFLEKNANASLLYLHTVGFHAKYNGLEHCIMPAISVPEDICTTDKKLFIKYAGYYWGFMSSFICSTEKFKQIDNPEIYFGTFWLQSYIHILCSCEKDAILGIIKGPCIGAGSYLNVANFDTSLVDGIYYKQMLHFAIEKAGYNKKQLEKLYIWRICLLGRHSIIKERALGIKKTNMCTLIKCTWKYPSAWIKLYPFLLIPNLICRSIMILYRKSKKLSEDIRINRPE